MACGCGKSKAAPSTQQWTVDLSVPAAGGKTFIDGTAKKTFATAGEAVSALRSLGLAGKVHPRSGT